MEKKYVPAGVFLSCDKGVTPSTLNVTFNANTVLYGQNMATEADKIPLVNIPPMGVCAITKGPCVPAPIMWNPVQNDVVLGNQRLLLEDSKLQCSLGGRISIFFSMAAAMAAAAPAPEKSLLDQADDYLATLGPAGDYARFQLGMAEGLYAGGKGLVEGLWTLAKGGWHAATHPVETATAIGEGVSSAAEWASKGENWSNAASAAGDGINSAADWASKGENWGKAWDGASEWAGKQSPRDWGKIGGRVTFEVALAVGTAGAGEALNAAGKAGEAANLLSKAGEGANLLEKGAEAANLASKAAEAGNAAGKASVLGKVTTGAEEAADLARAAEKAEEAAKAAKASEAVEGCASRSKCAEVGHPVDVSNGMVFTQQADLFLPGPVPLIWERTWYSRSVRRGPLGHGWHHTYDMALAVADDGQLALRLADGRLALFEAPENGGKRFNRLEKLEAEQTTAGQYRVWDIAQRVWYIFVPHPAQTNQVLTAVEDANGFAVRLQYSEAGHLQAMRDSAGRWLDFSSDAQGRIESVTGPASDKAEGRVTLARYSYDEAGNLTTATDALGQAMRFYYAGHLLVQETNRVGLSFYFAYDGTDHTARCLRTWGDDGIYDNRLSYPTDELTLVTDSVGGTTQYTHAQGLATLIIDPLGNVKQQVYNAYGELEMERDPLGQTTVYDYDGRGNLTAVAYPDGNRMQTEHANDLPITATDALGNQWQWAYDEAGNQIQRIEPTGLITISGYRHGLLHTVGTGYGQPTILLYDEQYNLREALQADGQRRTWQHDFMGRTTVLTDTRGNIQRRYYDLLGQLRRVDEPDGNVRHLTYDGEGNVLRAQDSYQDVTLTYMGLDWLASRAQSGARVRYDYDTEGQLIRITNEHDRTHEFIRNVAGQIIAETRFDGQLRRYERDAASQVLTQWVGEQATQFAYDPAGRVTSTTYPDGSQEQFTYRSDGSLMEARNEQLTVSWERNSLGQVLLETQGEHVVSSAYDLAGQRVALQSSLGAAVGFERDDYGEVANMRSLGWKAHFERDAQGLEVARTFSSGVQTRWHRDALGRPVTQQIVAGRQQRRRQYRWQGPDQLTELTDSLAGTTRFAHDGRGALGAALYPDGEEELRLPDAVGNLFQTPDRQDRQYGPAGQLLQANGTQYRYDELGNLTHKETANGQHWHYRWNGAGLLAEVTRPDGTLVSLAYDALGRRICKRYKGKVTHWVWDGNKPLHEWTELELDGRNTDDIVTWLFEENTFSPIAKLAGQKRYSILTDYLGTPLEMVDERGQQTWNAELNSYGRVRMLEGTRAACPFRYQGQYEDTETGLYYNRFRYYDPEAGSYISQDPIGLDGGLALYSYVQNPHRQVDIFGLTGTCPTAPRKSNSWNDFQKKTKGEFGSKAESLAEYKRLKSGTNPWPKDYVTTTERMKAGEKVNMAMGKGQPANRPGAFATTDDITDVQYVRDKLAVRSDFKESVDYVQEYEVIKDIDVIKGPVGPQIDPNGTYLPGGGSQVHFQFPDPPAGVKYLDRTEYLKPIGSPKPIK